MSAEGLKKQPNAHGELAGIGPNDHHNRLHAQGSALDHSAIVLDANYRQGFETATWDIYQHAGIAILWGTAFGLNTALLNTFIVPFRATVSRIKISVTTQLGNIDVGIYDSAGNLIVSSGSIACPAVGIQLITIASTTLGPGIYWLAISADSASAFLGIAHTAAVAHAGFRSITGFPLPATITWEANSSNRVWMEAC